MSFRSFKGLPLSDATLPFCKLRHGEGTAIAAPDRRPLTFGDLAEQIEKTGCALRAAGLVRTDRVALSLANGPEAASAFLSIAASCVCAPLNPAYREAELDFYLRDLRPKAVAVAEEGPASEVAARLGIDIIRLASNPNDAAGQFRLEGLRANGRGEFTPADPDDIALLLHTSGTTSRPKLVPLTWGNLGQSAANISQALALSPADCSLNVMPLFHIHGLVGVLLASLARGASVVCTPGFVATSFFDWLERFAPTWYSAVPTMHQSVLAQAHRHTESLARHRLRFIRSSSSALPVRVLEELESAFGVPVIEAYGMTEAAHQMASNPLPPGIRKPGSVGLAAGPRISVRGEAGEPLPAGTTGRIHIAGANVTAGYEDNPDANRESFVDGWFFTGDLGWLDEDGYLFLSGRSKEIINRGGEKISPREVDEVLMRHPSVQQCLAFALPDSKLGEEVGAVVVLNPDSVADEAAIQSFAVRFVADFKVPRRIFFLEEIPKGATGKPQRIGLAARLGITDDSWKRSEVSTARADATAVARVSAIMSEVLGTSSVEPDANFFDAGGDSLLGAQLLARLSNEFQCAFTLVDLFQAATPVAIAGRLSNASPTVSEKVIEAEGGSGTALSFGQVRLWFLDAYEGGTLAYLRPYLIEISGEIEPDGVRAALIRIIERHEPLRTLIRNDGGNPQPFLGAPEALSLEVRDWRGTAGTAESAVLSACREDASHPFRLDADLPLRATLHRLEERRWWLLAVAHHVAIDGWSARILVRELGALLRGEPMAPDALPVRYSDFARWQERSLAGERLEKLIEYWRGQLAGAPEVLDLPLDFPRPARQSFHGKVVSKVLTPDLTAGLRKLSQECGVTLFMTLLAVWQGLLARYSNTTDICVGVPVAGRARVEWEALIGLFMNTLALRSKLEGDPKFREILARVRETCLEAWSHQELPFEKLVESLSPLRSLAYTPYFQVLFQLRNFPKFAGEVNAPSVRQLDFELETVPTDLNLEVTESAQGLECRLFYNTALFAERTAERMLECFEVLLGGVAEAPAMRLSELPLLTVGERRQLLEDWNATEVPYPRDLCIHQLFEQQTARTPEATAVVFGDRRLTYGELNRRANQLAHHLREMGVKPDDLVGICVERSLEMVLGLLGILKAGGAYVPLDPAYPSDRLQFILQDTGATVVLTQAKLRRGIPKDSGIVCLDADWREIANGGDGNPHGDAGAENLAYVMYTSGSTGTPKGVEIPHRAVMRLLCGTNYASLTNDEVLLQLAPLAFDASTFEIWGALLHGGVLAVMPPEQPTLENIGRAIHDYKVTTLWLTAGLFHAMVEERAADLKPLRQLLAGGDVLQVSRVREVVQALGNCRLINGYGPTESATFACCYPVNRETNWERPIPIGRPIANTQIYILDALLEPVPVGVAGELCIGGDGLARGYFNRPELTAEKFIAHPFSNKPGARLYRTGDLARYLPDGNIEFLGRIDQQVKIRGYRVELEEIEATLRQHAGISQCVVSAAEVPAGEKWLVAWIVPVDARRPPAAAELRGFLNEKLPEFMVPAAFEILSNLPLNANGKVDRKALPTPDLSRLKFAAQQPLVDARTALELQLTQIWQRILDLPAIGVRDNFFELGGHSLLAVRLVSEIHKSMQYSLPLPVLFQNPTIEAMARVMENEKSSDAEVRLISLQPGKSPGTLFFLNAGIGSCRLAQLLEAGPASFGTIVPLDIAALRAETNGKTSDIPSLERVVAAHAALIRSQPSGGPCVLVGHSLGGLFAFEVAHQLEREGRRVEMILLLDASAIFPTLWQRLTTLTFDGAVSALKTRLDRHGLRVRPSAANNPEMLTQIFEPFGALPRQLFEKFAREASKTKRCPLDSRGVLFRAIDSRFARLDAGTGDRGWGGLFLRGLDIVKVPGDHNTMLRDPQVITLAERVQTCLERMPVAATSSSYKQPSRA